MSAFLHAGEGSKGLLGDKNDKYVVVGSMPIRLTPKNLLEALRQLRSRAREKLLSKKGKTEGIAAQILGKLQERPVLL